MTNQVRKGIRGAVAGIAIASMLAISGCAFMKAPASSTPENALTVNAARTAAVQGCIALGKSLKDNEREKVKASLGVVAAVLLQSTPENISANLMKIEPTALAPWSPAIVGLATIFTSRVSEEDSNSTLYRVITGVVAGCNAGLGFADAQAV